MKLILSLLKKILVSLSDFYRKDYVNAELDKRVDSTVFTSSLGVETAERKRVDLEISASIDDNEANDEALAKVIEWQGYADQICRSVDDEVAIAFAEEFEKATVEYLEDPTATKEWNAENSPYSLAESSTPVVDFNVVSATSAFGKYSGNVAFLPNATLLDSAFARMPLTENFILIAHSATSLQSLLSRSNVKGRVSVYAPECTTMTYGFWYINGVKEIYLDLPNWTNCEFGLGNCYSVEKIVIKRHSLKNLNHLFAGSSKITHIDADFSGATESSNAFRGLVNFNQPLNLPNLKKCEGLLNGATSFNQPLSLPLATNCSYMLYGATAFNSLLDLPNATNCSYMLRGATAFNQMLSLPSATNCSHMLRAARAFNQPFDLPNATDCSYLLYEAVSFNHPISLPKALDIANMLRGCHAFRQTVVAPLAQQWNYTFYNLRNYDNSVEMPSAQNAFGTFENTAMSAENISKTLDSLPTWTNGASHVITFTGCPGIVSTATMETFTVTDEDGTEYSMENCPIFDTDDEAQTLRKAFVLAVVKKGWTVEMTASAPYKRELAYLQATGTQWIDTGVACIMNTTAEYSVEVDTDSEISINTYELTGLDSGWYFGLLGRSENRKNWTINTSTAGTMETPSVVADTVYTVVQTWQSNTLTTTISDGVDTGTNSRSVSPRPSDQFRLFGLYKASGNSYECKCLRIKGVKYTQDGVLVRDFIPVLDGSGIPCMYDKVSGELFANKGTGTFAYGELDSGEVAEG